MIARKAKEEYDNIDYLWDSERGEKRAGALHTGYGRDTAAAGPGSFFPLCTPERAGDADRLRRGNTGGDPEAGLGIPLH